MVRNSNQSLSIITLEQNTRLFFFAHVRKIFLESRVRGASGRLSTPQRRLPWIDAAKRGAGLAASKKALPSDKQAV
jgi:hypothetical protein